MGLRLTCAVVLLGLVGCTPVARDTSPTTAPSTTSGAVTTAAGPSPADESITLLFTGDMLPSDALQAQAAHYAGGQGYDFAPMLARVAPIISSADWAICHQETPISDDNVGLSGYPWFNAPYELAEAERAVGYDACSTASNHTVDLGAGGIAATLDTLDRVGIEHTGSARSETEAEQLTIYDVGATAVGHLSYTYGLNGLPAPAPWAANLIDPVRIRADAARLKAVGADIVVVSLHMGIEKQHEPSAYQMEIVDQVMQSPDIDLIVSHHAHVVQPIEQRPDGRWVIYGLGNFMAQQQTSSADPTPAHRDGAIVEVSFRPVAGGRYAIDQVGYVPVFVDAPSDVIELAPPCSHQRTVDVLTSRGAPLVDLTPG